MMKTVSISEDLLSKAAGAVDLKDDRQLSEFISTAVAEKLASSSEKKVKDKVTIIVFSGDLDRVQAAFNIATGAASMGMDVTMFFTFWGFDVIKRNDAKGRGKGILRKAFSVIKPGGSKRLPLSRFNMLGFGSWAMKRLMGEFKMPTTDQMISMAKEMGVKIIACTITMGVMGVTKEDLVQGIDSYAGVFAYLDEAKESKINLFI
jgi:peroxiredoxin family protein